MERKDIIKPIVKNFAAVVKIKDEKLRQHTIETFLQGYFDDLLEFKSQ